MRNNLLPLLLSTFILPVISDCGFAQGDVPLQLTPVPASQGLAKPATDEEAKAKTQPAEVSVATVIEGLSNPFSVSIAPESDRVFVVEGGKQRIVEIKEGKAESIAEDFVASKCRGYASGPLSLFCADENILIVGYDKSPGEGAIKKLTLNPSSSEPAERVKDSAVTEIEKQGDDATSVGQFIQLVVKHAVVYAVTNGDAANGWIAVGEIVNGSIKSFRPSIATAKKSSFPNPTCATISPGGEYLVVSQMGTEGDAKDSRLVFYTLQGKLLMNLEIELNDIVALAYSPKRKHLFAIDYNYKDPSKGGLYKLIGKGTDQCTVKKLQDISFATSMAFDSKGNLFITTLGGPADAEGKASGRLLKITGLDEKPTKTDVAADNDATAEAKPGEDSPE